MQRGTAYQVFASTPRPQLSGADIYSANLVRALQQRGIAARILVTRPNPEAGMHLPLASDVPSVIMKQPRRGWRRRWNNLIDLLEANAPCIYLPNYDFDHSCVSSRLSDAVRIIGILHGDDPAHYDHVRRLGRYWNLVVAVSAAIADRTLELDPSLRPRLATIRTGVPAPPRFSRTGASLRPLRVVYAGRISEGHKRVGDLARVMHATAALEPSIHFTIVGSGGDEDEMRRACAPLSERGLVDFTGTLPNAEVLRIFEESDVFVLTSQFEGLPLAVMEAMGRGCVPVVSDVRSGIPELIADGVNGFRLPIGAVAAFAETIVRLHREPERRLAMAERAYETVRRGYSLDEMADSYIALFERALRQKDDGSYVRPRARLQPPPWIDPPISLRRATRVAKRVVHGMIAAARGGRG